jgi:hypothetical protein
MAVVGDPANVIVEIVGTGLPLGIDAGTFTVGLRTYVSKTDTPSAEDPGPTDQISMAPPMGFVGDQPDVFTIQFTSIS